jgi:hypothetical protein
MKTQRRMACSSSAPAASLFLLAATIGCGGSGSPAPLGYGYAYASPSDGGKIYAVPRGGGAAVVLAAGQGVENLGGGFTFDAGYAYYTDELYSSALTAPPVTSLLAIPLSGGGPRTIVSGLDVVNALAVDAENVYFIDMTITVDPTTGSSEIFSIGKVPLTGGARETLVMNVAAPSALAVASGFLYWNDASGALSRVPTAGGSVESVIASLGSVGAFAVDSTGIYWANAGHGSVDCGSRGGSIVALLSGSTQPITLVAGLANAGYAGSIAVLQGSVYFSVAGSQGCNVVGPTKLNGEVVRIAAGKSTPTTLASALDVPSNLFVDGATVYYTTATQDDAGANDYQAHATRQPPFPIE